MRLFFILALVALLNVQTATAKDTIYREIHSKHFFYGYPHGTEPSNDLIIRDIYALSNNDNTKFADWVAYRLDKQTVFGQKVKTQRNWKSDPWLEANETLEPSDYKGAHNMISTDRGHQAPIGSFKGTNDWHETNYLSNITPQKSDLNQHAWMKLENKIRELVKTNETVYVMTGPVYSLNQILKLPNADEPHVVPSGYWKIVTIPKSFKKIHIAAFIFAQDTSKDANLMDHVTNIDKIEQLTGLDFMPLMPLQAQNTLESSIDKSWIRESF